MSDATPRRAGSDPALEDIPPDKEFLRMMFFQARHDTGAAAGRVPREHATGAYAPLRHSTPGAGRCVLPLPSSAAPVKLDSPALEVMTDLRRVAAVTIGRLASLADANQVMIRHGVRALFVVDDGRGVLGLLTASDVLGERPVQVAQDHGMRHDEVMVRDIMTPADRLEVLDFEDVQYARVGDVVATLRRAGRQHALAVEAGEAGSGGLQVVRGIFSLTQVARQLGIAQQEHDVARTFAEIEAAIGR